MMLDHDEDALQTDSYIESLLSSHAGRPLPVPEPQAGPPPGLRRTIEVLEAALPRFHPSFLFEEALAARLRAAALGQQAPSGEDLVLAELIELPGVGVASAALDRRLLLGGAIASGVSLAGAAVVARRIRERGRPRRRWLA